MARKTVPPVPRSRASTIEGGLIGIEPDGVVGWAWNPARPDQPVTVRLMAGEQVLAEAVARQFDDPRVRMLAGPGIPGFVTRLAAAPTCGAPFPLSLHDPSGAMLGAPLSIRAAAELAPLIGLAAADTIEGHIDGVFDGALMGWARDPADPDRALTIDLLDTATVVGQTVADRLREDLRAAGLHHGRYGFGFALPVSLLDGNVHSLDVRVAGTSVLLRGGPVAFGPLAATALITQLSALQREVATLRAEMDGLLAPDGSVQRRILRILAERLAAQAEIQHDQFERDMAALRAMVFAADSAFVDPGPDAPRARRRRG